MLTSGDRMAFELFNTSLGWMGIVGSHKGLKRVILPQKSKEAVFRQLMNHGCVVGDQSPDMFGDLPHRLRQYLNGGLVYFPDSLDLVEATRFQQDVWQLVHTIPYGETRSYGWVANRLGLYKAARAVGQALGRNPVPIVVPCHRVTKSDGSLGGFGGGVEVKEFLLGLEMVHSM